MLISLKMISQTLVKCKGLLNHMTYSKTFNNILVRRKIWILTKSLRILYFPYPTGMGEACLLKRMMFVLNLQYLRRVNLRMRLILNLSFLNMHVSPHIQYPMPQRNSASDSPHTKGPITLRERERDSSHWKTNNVLEIQRSERGRIP